MPQNRNRPPIGARRPTMLSVLAANGWSRTARDFAILVVAVVAVPGLPLCLSWAFGW